MSPSNDAAQIARARQSKLPSLTGLRWIAAMMVFAFHTTSLNLIHLGHWNTVWHSIAWLGLYGVSFFFVLSGFVLVWSARQTDTKRAFWQRRFAKIWPSHAVTWGAVIIIGLLLGDAFRYKVAPLNLLLLQPWDYHNNVYYSINTVSWSLGCEMFFYLCLPFALPLVRRMRTGWLYALLLVIPVVMWAIIPLTRHMYTWTSWWLTQIFPPTRSLEFWMGVIAAELMLRKRWYGPGLWTATALYVGVYLLDHKISSDFWPADLALVFVLVIAGAAKADVKGTWSPWRSRVMVWLGEVSFAYYLVHLIVVQTLQRVTHHSSWPVKKAVVVVAFCLVVSLFFAWLLHRFVELPMMRILGPKRARSAPAPAPAQPVPAAIPARALPVGVGPKNAEGPVLAELSAAPLAREAD